MNRIEISIANQTLRLFNKLGEQHWSVSTALNGTGNQKGSGCTPLGLHKVKLKIGESAPINSVFIGRRLTGEIYSKTLAQQYPERDWILTRIIWLQGMESGFNRGGQVDTLSRFIYIHGTPDSEPMGVPKSHGCIRMRNRDLIELFDQIDNNLIVNILA
jgi:lipoprotein-anchoring transpeptidase ErfK/SrfK